jgi:hypothetical protein
MSSTLRRLEQPSGLLKPPKAQKWCEFGAIGHRTAQKLAICTVLCGRTFINSYIFSTVAGLQGPAGPCPGAGSLQKSVFPADLKNPDGNIASGVVSAPHTQSSRMQTYPETDSHVSARFALRQWLPKRLTRD